MKVERLLRITTTIRVTISENEYKEAKTKGELELIAIQELHKCLCDCSQPLLSKLEALNASHKVLHMEYNRDAWELLSTIVLEVKNDSKMPQL